MRASGVARFTIAPSRSHRREQGAGRGLGGLRRLALRFAALRVPCDARAPGLWPNSLRSLRSLRSNGRPQVRARSALRARPGTLCFSAAPIRPAQASSAALHATVFILDEEHIITVCNPDGIS